MSCLEVDFYADRIIFRMMQFLCLIIIIVLSGNGFINSADESISHEDHILQPGSQREASLSMPDNTGPLNLSIEDAILMALENNRSLRIEKMNPDIIQTYEQQEKAVFDPYLTAGYSYFSNKGDDDTENRAGGDIAIESFLPTGTSISLSFNTQRDWAELYSDNHASTLGLTVTQSLLRGSGSGYNLASVHQAGLDTLSSRYELKGYTEELVANVEKSYWNLALAKRNLEIYQHSMDLAVQQLNEVEERINVGKLAEIELAAAKAEVALRREALINAQSSLEKSKLRLLLLLNPDEANIWITDIQLKDVPEVPEIILDDIEQHNAVALKMRSDLNQALLSIKKGELEIAKTKNGLLPKLDLFISFGKTGYSDSFSGSVENIDNDNYSYNAAISFEFPFGNRNASARHKRAVYSNEQAKEALENLSQLIELDIRLAYIEVNRAYQQISATVATKQSQEEKFRAEVEKFRVGRSTALLVAQAQRDLVNAEISEVEAIVNYLNALVELFRIEGSLLERRGIKL